ncbi:MAG: HpcH/HpaI aldolase/citrate lyase family protein [Candidatus Methylomirabilales bacterium]
MLNIKQARLRRSVLAVPGSNPKFMEKAAKSNADEVFLDLEDACAPKDKEASRAKIVEALKTHDWGNKVRVVRINNVRTKLAYRDIIEVVEGGGQYIDVLMIPKINSPDEVRFVDRLLTQIEEYKGIPHRIGIEPQIETTEGLACVEEIARASNRLETLVWGPADYAASATMPLLSIGLHKFGYPGHIWHYPIARIVAAAKAAGLQAIDGPYAAIEDQEGFRESCRMAALLGCDGKWAIHPSQINPCNEIFTPTEEEVAKAKRIIKELSEAMEKEGRGAIAMDGEMQDAASMLLAYNAVDRAELAKARAGGG